jgi:hypothetical protein
MEDIIAAGFGLAMFAVMFGLFAFLILNQRKKTAARIAACEARGWKYTAVKKGFHLEGDSNGVPWTLKLIVSSSNAQSSGSPTTVWETPVAPSEEIVLFGPKLPPILTQLNLGGSVVQMVLKYLLGDDARDIVNVKEVHSAGSSSFNELFTVLATTSERANELIDSEVESTVLKAKERFKTAPVVLRWRDKLQVRLMVGTWSPEDIEALVTLGVEVAERSGRPLGGQAGPMLRIDF